MDQQNPDWITGRTWYNTSICKKIHRTVFEELIRNARTDIYNIVSSIDAHEKHQPSYFNYGNSGVGNELPSNSKK